MRTHTQLQLSSFLSSPAILSPLHWISPLSSSPYNLFLSPSLLPSLSLSASEGVTYSRHTSPGRVPRTNLQSLFWPHSLIQWSQCSNQRSHRCSWQAYHWRPVGTYGLVEHQDIMMYTSPLNCILYLSLHEYMNYSITQCYKNNKTWWKNEHTLRIYMTLIAGFTIACAI